MKMETVFSKMTVMIVIPTSIRRPRRLVMRRTITVMAKLMKVWNVFAQYKMLVYYFLVKKIH